MPVKQDKRVHFASQNTYHSPPVAVPSLTFSPQSSNSSAGPFTPPSLPLSLPGPSPYPFTLPPRRYPQQKALPSILMHSLLDHSHAPSINYDLTLSPATITHNHRSLSQGSLSESATNPPLSSLTIVVPKLPRCGTIVVTPSHNGAFVTVSDVLRAIHLTLRTNISPEEFHRLPSQNERDRVTSAYEARYRRNRDPRVYNEEKLQGVKRVDFLMGLTRFRGLARAGSGTDGWFLVTSAS